MSKVLTILSQFILLTTFSIYLLPQTAIAANCTFTYTPDPPNQNMGNLSVTIASNELKSGTYRIQGERPNKSYFYIRNINFTGTATITIQKVTSGWPTGQYTLYVIEEGASGQPKDIAKCSTSFSITDIPISSSCVASIENKSIDPDTGVTLVVSGISSGTHDILINNESKFTLTSDGKFVLGNFSVGTYTVTIKKDSRLQCNSVAFTVAPKGSGGGGQVGTTPGTSPTKVCKPGDKDCSSGGGEPCTDEKDGRGPAFKTAIGCIHTSPAEFIKDFLTFIIAISGGLAFLMMLLGAFGMLTSAGNPEALNAGRERLTSAIIGLLFVIFAILLMQIIGVGILNIPGFT